MLTVDCVHIYGWPYTGNIKRPDNLPVFSAMKSKRLKPTSFSAEIHRDFQEEQNILEGRDTGGGKPSAPSVSEHVHMGKRGRAMWEKNKRELEMRRQRHGGNYQENHLWVRHLQTQWHFSLKSLLHNYSMLTGHLCAVTLQHGPPQIHTHSSDKQERCFISIDTKKQS